MKKCRSCQKEIELKATKCPYCQTKQGNWASRHPIITGVLAVIIFLMIIGATSGKSSTAPQKVSEGTKVEATTDSSKPASSVAPVAEVFNVGDTVKLGEYQFTVDKVDKAPKIKFGSPKTGNEYIAVTVTIQNTGDKEVSYNPYDFKVQNSDGNQTDQAMASLDDALSSGTLAPGGKVTGSVPFEVPKGDTNLKLIYQPNIWLDAKRVTVNLQ